MALTSVQQWDLNSPTEFLFEERDSAIAETHDFGAGLLIPVGGVAYKVWGGKRSFFLYQSCPGMIPLYYAHRGTCIYFSQSMLAMRQRMQELGMKVKDICQAKEGVAYHLSQKGLRKYVVDQVAPEVQPIMTTMEDAANEALSRLIDAAKFLKPHKVLTLISGGTDGILTALALKLAGVDQKCVCIGRTEDDFDPKYARIYAQELGLDYEFMTLPESDEDLEALLARTLKSIEMVDFSNVLMGMCNQMIAEYAVAHGYTWVANADLADVILGNDIFSIGAYKASTEKPTAAGWCKYRVETGLKTLPTNLQIYKAFNFNGIRCAQLFADRKVINYVLGLPLHITPVAHIKPLYYEILNRYIADGTWKEQGKKVGYYTGSGIGKIRLDKQVLSDENIRKVYATIQ